MKSVLINLMWIKSILLLGWNSSFGTELSTNFEIYTFKPNNENLEELSADLKNFTGISFANESIQNLQIQVDRLDGIGHTLSIVGGYNFLRNIPAAHDVVLEAASNQILDPKNLLFYFHQKRDDSGAYNFRLRVKNPDLNSNEVQGIEQYVLSQTDGYYQAADNPIQLLDPLSLAGIPAYFSIQSEAGEDLPIFDENAVGGNAEQAPFLTIPNGEAFMSLAGIPIYLPAGSRVDFYSIDHDKWPGILHRFKLPDDDKVYTPWKWKNGPYPNFFSGYGYPEPVAFAGEEPSGKVIKYSYEKYLEQSQENLLPYTVGESIPVYLGFASDNCDETENAASGKYILNKKIYIVPKNDISANETFNFVGIPKYICSNSLISSFSEIENHIQHNTVFLWDSQNAQVVSVLSNNNPQNLTQTYDCWVDNVIPSSFDHLGIDEYVVFQWKETGQWGHMFKYKNKFFLAYTDNDADYIQLCYDDFYGWIPAQINHDGYTIGLVEALSWCAQTVGRYVGYGTFIGVNILIGNYAGVQYGISGAFVVDLGFAAAEGAFVYTTTGDGNNAINTFLTGAIGAGFGTILEKALSAYKTIGSEANTILRFLDPASGQIIEKNLDEFIERAKSDFNFTSVMVTELIENMKTSEDLARALLKDPDKVAAWGILNALPDEPLRSLRLDVEMIERLANDLLENSGLRNYLNENGLNGFLAWKYSDDLFPTASWCVN